MRYVRKPIEVEAVVWNGFDGVFEVVEGMVVPSPVDRIANDALAIHTMNGTKVASIGDYVCKDIVDGSIFVMRPQGFKLAYVAVEVEDEEEEA